MGSEGDYRVSEIMTNHFDARARELLRRADDDLQPLAGRTFVVEGTLGDFYGATLVAGHEGEPEIKLICEGKVTTYE